MAKAYIERVEIRHVLTDLGHKNWIRDWAISLGWFGVRISLGNFFGFSAVFFSLDRVFFFWECPVSIFCSGVARIFFFAVSPLARQFPFFDRQFFSLYFFCVFSAVFFSLVCVFLFRFPVLIVCNGVCSDFFFAISNFLFLARRFVLRLLFFLYFFCSCFFSLARFLCILFFCVFSAAFKVFLFALRWIHLFPI